METKLLISGSSGTTYVGFLGWWTSGTSEQMKLFNLMNCWAIDTSGKLDVKQVAWTSFILDLFHWHCLFAFEKKSLPPPPKKPLFLCIKHTECGMDWRKKLKVSKKMVDEFKAKNIA